MKLELSKFKKIHDGPSHATLMHPMGHRITIAKDKLTDRLKKQLHELPSHAEAPEHFAEGGMSGLMSGIATGGTDEGVVDPAKQVPAEAINPTGNMSQPQQNAQPPAPAAPSNYNIPKPAPQAPIPQQQFAQSIQKPYESLEQSAQKIGQAESQGAQQAAQAAQDYQSKVQDIYKGAQDHLAQRNSELMAAQKDLGDGHIDPNHYINDKSALGKVATAFGLILGGFGGGLQGKGNPALEFLDRNIQRDVEAQKATQANKENIFSNYLKLTKNDQEATAMTHAFYGDLYNNKLQEIAANTNDPIAIQRANIVKQGWEKEKQQLLMPYNIANSIQEHVAKQGGAVDPVTASIAASAIPDPKDKEAAQKEAAKYQQVESLRNNMKNSFKDLNQQMLAGKLSPSDRQSAVQAFAGQIAKLSEGRFNLQEAGLQAEALLPSALESNSTRMKKAERLESFFDSLGQYPVLQAKYPGIAWTPKRAPVANQNAPSQAKYGQR